MGKHLQEQKLIDQIGAVIKTVGNPFHTSMSNQQYDLYNGNVSMNNTLDVQDNSPMECDLIALLNLPPNAQSFIRNHLKLRSRAINSFVWTNIGYVQLDNDQHHLIRLCSSKRSYYFWVYNIEKFTYEMYYQAPGSKLIGPILDMPAFIDVLSTVYTITDKELGEVLGDHIVKPYIAPKITA